MSDIQKEQVKKIVYTFASLSNVNDNKALDGLIEKLVLMNENDVIDYLIVSISDLVDEGNLKPDDVFSNIDLITSLSVRYSSKEDLFKRLDWLKGMNMLHPKMPLSENHKLVIDTFDKFNELIGTNFDSYYTGGLMGYLATDHPLERYHSDLDLFINEEQLESLYELVKKSSDFEFISNMHDKEKNGHEFKIQYKGTPMSIGLFLFERKPDNEIVIKEYYHDGNNINNGLLVNEKHLLPEYAGMVFSDVIKNHNGIPYRMQSLESIYNVKKNSRPKDKYDADIIKNYVDMMIDYKLDVGKQNNYDINRKSANGSVVFKFEGKILSYDSCEKRETFSTEKGKSL